MRALTRKLLRDVWHLRGQVAAIAVVVACGVAVFVTTRTAYDSLLISQAEYYAAYRFADVFASLKRAPDALAPRIAALPGVAAVNTRVVFEVVLDVPGLSEPATGRLVSIPERRTPILNDLYLRHGRWVEPGRRDEVIVGAAFAKANGLSVGDSLDAILNGRWERLRIVGIALSPEYVYEIRGSDIFPDNRRFGVLWMSRDAMGPAYSMDGAFNDVVLTLTAAASEPEVLARLDRLLERYGGLGAYGREDQISHKFLSDEIRQNQVFGVLLPAIFLGVAAFLVNIVLSRLVAMQRDQIAVLKAFGYGNRPIALHYVQFALVAVLAGGVIGIGLGLWLGAVVNRMYVDFYRFPVLRFEAGPTVVLWAVVVAGSAALLGAGRAVRGALALPPAEAMRPESPTHFHAGMFERSWLRERLTVPTRIIARNLLRRPTRAVLSVIGIAFAVAIVIVGRYFVDAVRYIADVQFRIVERDDVTVVFHDPAPARARHDLWHLPGILRAEAFRATPVRLRYEHRTYRTALLGLPTGTELRRLIDQRLGVVDAPVDGVLLTTKLGEILGVAPGDLLGVEILEGERRRALVPVTGFVDELVGVSAYMDLGALGRLLRESNSVSGAFLSVDAAAAPALYHELKQMPAVASVSMRTAMLESFEQTLARSMGIFTTILVSFACAIAVAMVYNAARVALSERGRELASLRVLGFTRGEVAIMLLGEQAVLTALAIPLGYAIGYGLCAAIANMYQWELFRLPLFISADSYAFAFLVVLGASIGSGWLVRRRLDRLDLVEVLKTRE